MKRVLVVAEDGTGAWTAKHVADLVLQEVPWIRDNAIDDFRQWQSFEGDAWFALKRTHDVHRSRGLPAVRGHFTGEPGAADALLMRKLFRIFEGAVDQPDVLLVARDVDSTERWLGLRQARESGTWSFQIAVAHAQPEVEAWLISTWEPDNSVHEECLAELRRELGFDPAAKSHQLTSTSTSRRDAKSVSARLAASGKAPADAFRASDLIKLRACGAGNGLAAYIDELRAHVVPLFTGQA